MGLAGPKSAVGVEHGGWSSSPPARSGGLGTELLTTGRWRWLHRVLFVLLFVLPTLALTVVSVGQYRDHGTQSVLKAKEQQALAAATIVSERLNAEVNLGLSFATRPQLVRNVEQGRWEEAMKVLNGVVELYPAIDRVVLLDAEAVIRAELPGGDVVGQSRAERAWFKAFATHDGPYVTGVYLRMAAPQIHVVGLVLPVRAAPGAASAPGSKGKLVGILHLQLSLRGFSAWTRMDVGPGGRIYVFDQRGVLVSDSRPAEDRGIIDSSSAGVVRKALAGYNEAGIDPDPIDGRGSVIACRTLPRFGWAVLVAQPAEQAFAERDEGLRTSYVTFATLTFMALLLSLAIVRIVVLQKVAEERQRKLAFLDELTGLNNRRGFMALSAMQLGAAARLWQRLFFVYADLNGMKLINDRFGHKEGDRALIDTAQILRTAFRDIDIKARIGGDEFVVLGTVREGFDAEVVKSRLRKATLTYLAENPRPYQLSLSCGIVFYEPEQPCTLEELIERGDHVMYEIKADRHRTPAGAVAV